MALTQAGCCSRMAVIRVTLRPWWMRPAGLSTLPNSYKSRFRRGGDKRSASTVTRWPGLQGFPHGIGLKQCHSDQSGFLSQALATTRGSVSKPLPSRQEAPLSNRHLAQRNSADADAPDRDYFQTDL